MPVLMGPLSTKHNTDELTTVSSSQKIGLSSLPATSDELHKQADNNFDMANGDMVNNTISKGVLQIYYAVHIPLDSQSPSSDNNDCLSPIFEDKQEALKLVKKYKRARFKVFNSLVEATHFSINGAGVAPSTPSQTISSNLPIDGPASAVDPSPIQVGEKPSPFKGPKSQDLVRLRKAIENGDILCVQRTVWENPRYLVSSGDTPAILHEGSRYNALHVCAKSNRANICSLILMTISNIDFIRRLYGDNNESIEAAEDRCNVLLDLYLNTPDKGFNETPLHFAVKHGAVDVAQVLVTYSQCDKTMLNKFGQAPKDIICSRVSGAGDNSELYKKISMLLDEQFFVPVLRSQDQSIQPTVGQPFSASNPLKLCGDIIHPAMEVQGVAGPMPLESARVFRRKWKTPPRDPKSPAILSPVLKTMLQDPDKGLEKIGRDLADENNVCWTEYWPFLNTFANFRTEAGLDLLEQYLLNRFKQGTDFINENNRMNGINKSSLPTKSVNGIANGGLCSQSTATSVKSPISELCDALRSCRLSSGSDAKRQTIPSLPVPPAPPQQNYERYNGIVHSDDTSVAISPHLYIEKSCQVFMKRIADGLLRHPDVPSEAIACEVVYLNMLVASCLNDSRFSTISFAKLHCRLAALLVQKFCSDERDILVNAVDVILNKRQKAEESSSEEELTPFRDTYRRRINRQQKVSIDASVRCIVYHISNILAASNPTDLSVSNPPTTEDDCISLWQLATPCDCVWSPQQSRLRHSFRRSNYSSTARRIDFSSVNKGNKRDIDYDTKDNAQTIEKAIECCEESAGEESDTSDTECGEFFTPPSSPREQRTPSSSEDDLEMESPDEGPEVYIDGDVPTSLDNAVLDALGETNLDLALYPNICRWKHLVMLHSAAKRERWPSPRKLQSAIHESARRALSFSSPCPDTKVVF